MSEYATRTTTSPGSRSSSVRSTNSARIFFSGVSVSRYALNFSTHPPALDLQVFGRLHLVQPADGALELRALLAFDEDLLGRRGGRDDQLDPVIVEHIHQPGEAPRRVGLLDGEARHAREHHGMEAPRQVDVVGVGPRPPAQRLEIEPHQPAGPLAVGNGSAFDVERLLLFFDVLERLENARN